MKLKEFLANINQFVRDNPEALELNVVTSTDAEGNGYDLVYYTPTKGIFFHGEFISTEEYEMYGKKESETNAVCIN